MMREPDLAQDARAVIGELRVDPASLAGRHRARKDKAERMASVLEGREVCTLFFLAVSLGGVLGRYSLSVAPIGRETRPGACLDRVF